MEKQTYRIDLRTWEEGRRGYWKSNMETYITIYKIDSQWEFAVWLRKLKQRLCINLEEWDGEGNGREFPKGGYICKLTADSCWGLTENNKILYISYPSIKNKLKKETNKQAKNTIEPTKILLNETAFALFFSHLKVEFLKLFFIEV